MEKMSVNRVQNVGQAWGKQWEKGQNSENFQGQLRNRTIDKEGQYPPYLSSMSD